mmetsp:Transcript_96186/g.249222  ORF Transcript_96186/g.249222 Transcript_96186/m.249222 type:complete len:104 (+) Transcript_96186:555-866(+)
MPVVRLSPKQMMTPEGSAERAGGSETWPIDAGTEEATSELVEEAANRTGAAAVESCSLAVASTAVIAEVGRPTGATAEQGLVVVALDAGRTTGAATELAASCI